jgi:hypothetical protein
MIVLGTYVIRQAAHVLESAVKIAGESVSEKWQQTHLAALKAVAEKQNAQRER